MTWDDIEEIADTLYESYPETAPLSVSFPRLHQMISGLDGFDDDPNGATERILELIQMAWYDLVQ
ncbi:MAG: Fe-S cluster assembly protein IscX [Armatimonadota bacterium]